ncbi:hypothetical protein GOB57_24920 [Sinorhizobium meliloti]|nr:hypothetical protein [Sinorhizobium meliloti]
MKQLPKDFLTIGRGAEYVVRGTESIILVSAGRHLEVTTRLLDKSLSNVVLRDPSSPETETVIFAGSAAEAMQAYLDLCRLLTQKQRLPVLSIVKSLAVSVASIAVVAALTIGYVETRRIAAELAAAETTPVALPQQIPAELSTLVPGVGAEASSLKVLKKPDFLISPTPTNPDVSQDIPSARHPSAADTIADIGLPAYNPTLYTTGTSQDQAVSGGGSTAAGKATISGANNISGASASEQTSKPEEKAERVEPKDKAATTEKKPDEPIEEDEKAKAAQQAAFQKDAAAAVKRLIGNGMSDGDVRNLLMNLQQINAGGDQEITPEMLRALPEEIAALLADQGMELDGPGGGTMNILPSEVVDQFRGNDGVATIPENYSWYARTGGPVSIPLPGGGDIKHPDDFKDFGLQP